MSTTVQPNLSLARTATASIPTTSHQACTWPGHCLGDPCSSNNDCDNDWICANKVCSPCCETPSATATPAPAKSHKGLPVGTAIGIGIAIVVAFGIAVGIGWWIWHVRHRKRAVWEAPSNNPSTPHIRPSHSSAGDRKHLMEDPWLGELPCPSKPTELSSVELVELEGDHGGNVQYSSEVHKPPIAPPPQTVPRPRYRFEEYEISPEAQTRGQFSFSPVSDMHPQTPLRRAGHSWYHRRQDAELDTLMDARDGSGSPYTLFRWPDS